MDPQTPAPIPPQPKPFPFLPVLLAFFVLLLSGSTVYLTYQNTQLQKQIAVLTATPIPSPAEASAKEGTANWKTHTDPKNTFTFKYPNDGFTIKINTFSQSPINGQTLDQWYKSLFLEDTKYDNEATIFFRKNINNESGISLVEYTENNSYMVIYTKSNPTTVNQTIITPPLGNTNFSIFDQILSTFKFCRPRPACLDATPRCMIPETSNMCPPSLSQ